MSVKKVNHVPVLEQPERIDISAPGHNCRLGVELLTSTWQHYCKSHRRLVVQT